jgi:hypothetical protein
MFWNLKRQRFPIVLVATPEMPFMQVCPPGCGFSRHTDHSRFVHTQARAIDLISAKFSSGSGTSLALSVPHPVNGCASLATLPDLQFG